MTEGIYQLNLSHHIKYITNRVPYNRTEDACGMVAVDKNSRMVGAVIFDNFLHSSAQITLVISSPKAIKLGLLECAVDFLFTTCKKQYAFAFVAQANEKSLRLCKRVGFRYQMAIPKGYSEDCDLLLFRLDKDEVNLRTRKEQRVLNYVQA